MLHQAMAVIAPGGALYISTTMDLHHNRESSGARALRDKNVQDQTILDSSNGWRIGWAVCPSWKTLDTNRSFYSRIDELARA